MWRASTLACTLTFLLANDDSQNIRISEAKRMFAEVLAITESKGGGEKTEFFQRLREAADRFEVADTKVLALQQAGNLDEALRVHLEEERPISVEVEQR